MPWPCQLRYDPAIQYLRFRPDSSAVEFQRPPKPNPGNDSVAAIPIPVITDL